MRTPRPLVPPGRSRRVLAALAALAGLAVQAAPPEAALPEHKVRSWASACYSCHGPDGKSQFGMPPLNGRSAGEIAGALLGFREGSRSATVMHQHAKGYSPEQLNAIAAHVAAGKK